MRQRKAPASWPGASGAPSERIPIDTNYPGFRCAHPGLSYNAASRLKAGISRPKPLASQSLLPSFPEIERASGVTIVTRHEVPKDREAVRDNSPGLQAWESTPAEMRPEGASHVPGPARQNYFKRRR
jgi:hypothetical protein